MEQLDKVLAESISKTGDLVISQLPDIVHQTLIWYGISSFSGTIVIICALTVYFKALKKYHSEGYTSDLYDGVMGVSTFIAFIFSVALLPVTFIWLKILIAPKLWLIEYAADLVK